MDVKLIHHFKYYSLRIFYVLIGLFVLYLVYFFRVSGVIVGNYAIYNPFYSFVNQLLWWQYILVYFIAVSFINIVVFFMLSLFISQKKRYLKKKRDAYKTLFSQKLIEYIYSDLSSESKNKVLVGLRDKLKTKLSKEVFFSVLVEIHEIISDDIKDTLRGFIYQLGLQEEIVDLLHTHNMSKKIIAMKVISYLNIKGFEKLIIDYSKSDNYVLRTEAMAAVIPLMDSHNLNQLLSNKHLISMLDVNVIVNTVLNGKYDDVDYESILVSPNPRTAIVGLLLIRSNNKVEYINSIKEIINTRDDILREVAWDVFASFASSSNDMKFMIRKYDHETITNKQIIIKGLARFGDSNSIENFLEKVVEHEPVFLKIEALKIFFKNNIMRLYSFKESDNESVIAAYKEVVDLNLN